MSNASKAAAAAAAAEQEAQAPLLQQQFTAHMPEPILAEITNYVRQVRRRWGDKGGWACTRARASREQAGCACPHARNAHTHARTPHGCAALACMGAVQLRAGCEHQAGFDPGPVRTRALALTNVLDARMQGT